MLLADSHTHLDFFPPQRVPWLLDRARAARVGPILTVGVTVDSSRQGLTCAQRHPELYAAVGVHPWWAHTNFETGAVEALAQLVTAPEVVAIGEIGLDYQRYPHARAEQRAALRAQLQLARRLGKPVVLHDIGSGGDLRRLWQDEGAPALGGIVHYFVGDHDAAERYLAAGLHLSVGKVVARPAESGALRAALPHIPRERLLLETDAVPRPERPPERWTQPADIPLVAAAVAELWGCPVEEVARTTTANLRRLLRLPPPAGAMVQ